MKSKIFFLLLAGVFLLGFYETNAQVNQRDDQGRRQGEWEGRFPNGRIRYQGQFTDDRPVGTFTYFNNDGSLRAELVHNSGVDTVNAVFFHRNRNRRATGKFLNQLRTGEWTLYSEQGVKLSQTWYQNDVPHGATTMFFPSGLPAERVHYSEGRKHGEWQQFYENGQKRLTAHHQNGMLSGVFNVFHENGHPLLTAQYLENLPQSLWRYYTAQGELIRERYYKNGVLEREVIYIEQEIDPAIPLQPGSDPIFDMIRSY
jgi:antitoxin component YwqK of YwqJK toxin-antitoxin module